MNEQFTTEPNEKARILIVDNNWQFARSARVLLDQSGKYTACTVIDPRRALESAQCRCRDVPDLADRAARRAAGLENADVVQQTLIHINEIDAEQPIEAELVTTVETSQG